jgi:phosphatidylinositol glycan class K
VVSVVVFIGVFIGGFVAPGGVCALSNQQQNVDNDAATFTRVEDTWAVIIDASRFWFNYRHGANALSMYRSVKRMGVPDSRIVLMLADDHACDARNPAHGRVYNDAKRGVELYGDDVEVDYRGTEVTPENVVRVLTNRHEDGTPRSKKLSLWSKE